MGHDDNWDRECLEACLMGQALDGMCLGMVLTTPTGRVAWVNRTARNVLDLDPDEVTGEPLANVLQDPQMTAFWHKARHAPTTMMGEVSLLYPRPIELKVNATNCVDTAGECIGRGMLFCDVTEERSVQVKLTEAATRRLLDLTRRDSSAAAPVAGLTATELKVLGLVGQGLGNQEIADEMTVAPSTIRSHLKQVYKKTGLASRSEAVAFAIQNGLA
jgi:DNA-binding CsgD family transcriptional regulator